MKIIGRERERRVLSRCEESPKPEFVAVYGRYRVGKTFLIAEHFGNKFTFSVTGIAGGGMKEQLRVFHTALKKHFKDDVAVPKDWRQAFGLLEERLEQDITLGKKVLFIDEIPWLDTPKSGFLAALEHFWHAFASKRQDILLIACGSAASWIIKKLLKNQGGLHNMVTETIMVEPFSLGDCEKFYRSRGIAMNRQQIAEAYMILGGIPYYMEAMDKMYGLNQNVDLLLFNKNAKLGDELSKLYNPLFRYAGNHICLAETLSKSAAGLTRQELSAASGISDGGGLSKVLDELAACGFIDSSRDFKKKKSGDYYKLADFYSLFHFKFLQKQKARSARLGSNYLSNPAHSGWRDYAFARLCQAHVRQIKQKLGISGVITQTYAFRSSQSKDGCRIGLIIDRRDAIINLCECKYTVQPYELTANDAADLERKKAVFLQETGTKKSIHTTLISANGLVHNAYCNKIQAEITLDDLFQPLR